MKKSTRTITLTLLASTLLTLPLSGCDDDPKPDEQLFTSKDACLAVYDADTCGYAASIAEKYGETEVKQYDDLTTCQMDNGDCTASQTHSGVFVPLMAGFMIKLADGSVKVTPMHYGRNPDCKDHANCTSAGSAHYIYSPTGYVGSYSTEEPASRSAPIILSRASVGAEGGRAGASEGVARGGLGATAEGHAGGGE